MKITNKTTKFIEKSLKICKGNSLTLTMFSFKRYIKSNEDSLVLMMAKVKLFAGEKAYLFLVWHICIRIRIDQHFKNTSPF